MQQDQILTLEEITEAELWAMAQFVKRVGYQELRINASSDAEAERMITAMSKLQSALQKVGYNPR